MRCVVFVVADTSNIPFPLDMLRYDACYPMLSAEIELLDNPRPNKKQRFVTLAHNAPRKGWKPTHKRWASFGWEVRGIVRDEAVK